MRDIPVWVHCPCKCHTHTPQGWAYHDNAYERYTCPCVNGFLPNPAAAEEV